MHFCQSFGLSKCLPDEKMALKKALPNGNLALNGITGRELGSQNHLPNENLAIT